MLSVLMLFVLACCLKRLGNASIWEVPFDQILSVLVGERDYNTLASQQVSKRNKVEAPRIHWHNKFTNLHVILMSQ